MATFNIINASISVGTYKKYTHGNLKYKDFLLSDFDSKDAFINACEEFHKDENEPELMFVSFSDIPRSLVSESHIDDVFWSLLESAKGIKDANELEGFNAWVDINEYKLEFTIEQYENLYEVFGTQWQGKFESLEFFYIDYLEDSGYFDCIADEHRKIEMIRYFDFEGFARDEEINDNADFNTGHVFVKRTFYNE